MVSVLAEKKKRKNVYLSYPRKELDEDVKFNRCFEDRKLRNGLTQDSISKHKTEKVTKLNASGNKIKERILLFFRE